MKPAERAKMIQDDVAEVIRDNLEEAKGGCGYVIDTKLTASKILTLIADKYVVDVECPAPSSECVWCAIEQCNDGKVTHGARPEDIGNKDLREK